MREASLRWLWVGRIPLGKLTLLDGDPGLGKSLITPDLVARLTTGSPMPDGTAGLQTPMWFCPKPGVSRPAPLA